MKNKLFVLPMILFVATILFVVAGCSQQGSVTKTDNTPNHTTPWETGIAGVNIGATTQEASLIIGKPDEIQILSDYSALWRYNNIADYGILYGKITVIQSHYYTNTGFAPTNIGHVHLKSTSQEVISAYGQPDDIYIDPDPLVVASTYTYWKDKNVSDDVEMEVKFFKDNTVHSIRIVRDATEH